jgi:hypothetical protein
VGAEHGFGVTTKFGVVGAGFGQPGTAAIRGQFQRVLE